jgi:hypothetical protein
MKKSLNTRKPEKIQGDDEKANLQEYPLYPESEDIYNKFKEEQGLDPEDPSKRKTLVGIDYVTSDIQKEPGNGMPGSDLDIPGSELDDELEIIGSEDEENNYYSLGGDDHNNLDEDKDEL